MRVNIVQSYYYDHFITKQHLLLLCSGFEGNGRWQVSMFSYKAFTTT